MRIVLLLGLALPITAMAVPLQYTHQGRLLDSLGVPVNDTVNLTLTVHQHQTGAGLEWSEDHLGIDVVDGYYTVGLGSIQTLDSAVFDGTVRFLSVAETGGTTFGDRTPILSVPYAVRADTATNVDGGDVVAATLTMPNRPSFSATTIEVQHSSTGTARIDYDDTVGRSFDIGNVFDPATDTFTAPVDGLYWLAASARIDDLDISYIRFYMNIDGTLDTDYSLPHAIYDLGTGWEPRYFTANISGVVKLDANETVRIVAYTTTDADWRIVNNQGRFTGFLISEL